MSEEVQFASYVLLLNQVSFTKYTIYLKLFLIVSLQRKKKSNATRPEN